MSAYLKSLVQRANGARVTAAVGPVRTPTSLGESPWRAEMRPVAETVVPSTRSEEAAAASGAGTADLLCSRFTAFVPAVPGSNKLQPPHAIYNTVRLPERVSGAETSQEIRPTTSVSILQQSPTEASRQQFPAVSPEVSSPPRPTPAPTKVSAERMAELEIDTHAPRVTNLRPRTASPPPLASTPGKTGRRAGEAEAAASMISKTVPAEFVRPRGQGVCAVPEIGLAATAQTASIEATHYSAAGPVRAFKPVTPQRTKAVVPQTLVPAAAPALRLPPVGPANRSGQRTGEIPPGMQVRIGRVEVRAAPVQEAPPTAAPASAARGFDDYVSLRAYTRDNY